MSGLQQQHQERQERQPQQQRLRLGHHWPSRHGGRRQVDINYEDDCAPDVAVADLRHCRRKERPSDASHRAVQSQSHPAVGLLVLLAAAPLLLLMLLRQKVGDPSSSSSSPPSVLVHAFSFTSYGGRIAPGFRSSASVVAPLHMGRKGRGGGAGKLGDLVDLATTASTTPSTTKSRRTTKAADSSSKKKTTTKSSSTAASGGGISPLLAQWAAETSTATSSSTSTSSNGVTVVDDNAASSTSAVMSSAASPSTSSSSRSSSNSRRERQSQRQQVEREREELVERAVRNIRAMLSDDDDGDDEDNKKKKEPFRVESLLEQVQELMDLPQSSGTNLRQLTAGSQSTDYRLAWVGSDEAMCELGTGLHKVKLARLQEVFMTLGPKSRVQMYEVIRILGPFPNVKNTLVGKSVLDSKSSSRSTTSTQPWRITWESLIDGTGKEILAGTKVRHVDLQVLWCDKNLVVCSTGVATNTDSKEGPADELLNDGGRNLFVFIKEDRMESKLDALRVI